MTAEAVRAWLTARYDEDEQAAYRIRDQRWCVEGEGVVESDVGAFAHEDRILREVAAKRRRLERHAPRIYEDYGYPPRRQAICEVCGDHWPCPDIIDDAQAYRDEPGFPAELRLP